MVSRLPLRHGSVFQIGRPCFFQTAQTLTGVSIIINPNGPFARTLKPRPTKKPYLHKSREDFPPPRKASGSATMESVIVAAKAGSMMTVPART